MPQVLQNILGPTPFLQAKMGMWTTTIIENVLKELKEINDESAKAGQQDDEEMGQLWKFIGEASMVYEVALGSHLATQPLADSRIADSRYTAGPATPSRLPPAACLLRASWLLVLVPLAVTCHIQQKTGAGMSSATCCYWDNENDGA